MKPLIHYLRRDDIRCAAWISVCFSLASGLYLSWLYHLLPLVGETAVDIWTMVAGYLAQAAGVGTAVWLLRREGPERWGWLFTVAVCLLLLASGPALLSASVPAVLAFGLLLNLCCGVCAGFYLLVPARQIDRSRRGRVFGCGYGTATVLIWLFSLSGAVDLRQHRESLLVYLLLAGGAIWLSRPLLSPIQSEVPDKPGEESKRKTRALAAFTVVVLLSLVKNLGFRFPSADISHGVNLELSRVFYAVGLIAAGFVTDRSRKTGAVCTVAALVIPFVLLSFSGEPVPHFVFWSLDYLFYGFFSVYRVVLFLDLAEQSDRLLLAPLGLLAGRLGDALGTGLCILLEPHRVSLVLLTAALFMLTVFLFFRLFQRIYEPETVRRRTEREVFDTFAMQHDLSSREKEVLRLLLSEQPNAAIAETLCVSESTIKFHVHNLLQKTGAKSRKELVTNYQTLLYARNE